MNSFLNSDTFTTPQTSSSNFFFSLILGLVLVGSLGYLGYQNWVLTQDVAQLRQAVTSLQTTAPLVADQGAPLPDQTLTTSASGSSVPQKVTISKPANWIKHAFPTQNLVVYTPPDWKSSLEEFPSISSTLLRFWQGNDPKQATMQLNITKNWDNIGRGPNPSYFEVAGNIQAYRYDPPAMRDQKLDRYQSNFYFEKDSNVYTFNCVHNWIDVNIDTCEKLLQTLELQ